MAATPSPTADDNLVGGRGNNKLDGGTDIDTASYKNLYDPAVGTPITQGVSISITGNQATVTKPLNGAVAGPAGASVETDTVENVERFEGTDRDDVFTAENLSGNMYITGGAGNDTLIVKDPKGAYTLDMTGGNYPAGHPQAGQAYSGTVSDGTNTIYLEDFKAADVTIDQTPEPAATPDVTPDATPDGARKVASEINLRDAVQTIASDQQVLNERFEASGVSSPARDAVNHPDAVQMFDTLQKNGVQTLDAEITAQMDPEERVGTLLNAGINATREAGLPMPEEQAEAEVSNVPNIHIPEAAREDDHSLSL